MGAPAFRQRLKAGETLYSAWIAMGSPRIADAVARDGWDAVIVDVQHGLADYEQIVASITAIVSAGIVPVVRVPMGDDPLLGRCNDAGALGIICPMINTPADAKWFAGACKYPPLGARSWGPMRAMQIYGLGRDDYFKAANEMVLSFAMIETRSALDNIDAIASTPGIDALFVGPNDLCVSLTNGAMIDVTHPDVIAALELIVRKCNEHGIVPGAFANTPEIAQSYRKMGFRFISVGTDAGYLAAGSQGALATAKR